MERHFKARAPLEFKKILFGLSVCFSMLYLSSCNKDYDDAWIKEAIEDLTDRVTVLEDWCKTANSNISSLQALISSLEQNDYITSVTPVTENGKEIGYTITFKNSPAIIIYHGKDGEDGDTPVIGVGKGDDGKYYWTQTIGDNEPDFILDEDGNKIAATGNAPQLGIDSEGYWMIDTDGTGFVRIKDENGHDVKAAGEKGDTGATGPTGPQGDSIFKEIDYSNSDYVLITLIDGTVIKIARQPATYVNVTQPGSLSTAIQQTGVDAASLRELTITGTLGEDDYEYIRTKLTSLEVLDISKANITILPEYAFDGATFETIVLPDKLKEIGNTAFYNCSKLKSLDIPESVTTLGRWIVYNCSSLESIALHEGLTTLSQSTFCEANVSSITIPSTVSFIPNWCFENSKLTSITIPSSIKTIGESVFFNCTELTTVNIEADLKEIPDAMFSECRKLTTVNLPENITYIGFAAFSNCPLQCDNGVLVIPSKVKIIKGNAFSTLTSNITSIQVQEGLEVIEPGAFAYIQIEEITLPSTLKQMGDCALCFTTSHSMLKKITFNGNTPPEIIYYTDYDGNYYKPDVSKMSECEVYVPADAVDTYKASVWFTGTTIYDEKQLDYFDVDKLHPIN